MRTGIDTFVRNKTAIDATPGEADASDGLERLKFWRRRYTIIAHLIEAGLEKARLSLATEHVCVPPSDHVSWRHVRTDHTMVFHTRYICPECERHWLSADTSLIAGVHCLPRAAEA